MQSWLRQPTTIAGISAAVPIITAALVGQIHWQAAAIALSGCVVAMLLPDNTAAKTDAQQLAETVVRLSAGDKTAIVPAVEEAAKLVADIAPASGSASPHTTT